MPRHVIFAALGFVFTVIIAALFLTWASIRWHLPVLEPVVRAIHHNAPGDAPSEHLSSMASRLGELQAQILQLDSMGERLLRLMGATDSEPEKKGPPGSGGPFIPADGDIDYLQGEIDRLALALELSQDRLGMLERNVLEARVSERLLPTALPVRDAFIGSPFGGRLDPLYGRLSRHEGLDFNGAVGTPVRSAADGIVLRAEFHREYGNVVDVDHGAGLVSRYAHLKSLIVSPGQYVRRSESIGQIGMTGRTTGPHLHFEVRLDGVAVNPARFLKRKSDFAFGN